MRIGLLGLALLCVLSAQEPVFQSDSRLVVTPFHVTAAHQYVTGLHASDFELLVDGKPRPITVFESGGQRSAPVEILLLFDTSGSVTGNDLLDEKLFRENLLVGLPGVTISVYRFGGGRYGNNVVRMTSATDDPARLRDAFQGVVKKGPGDATFELGKPGKDSLIYESIAKVLAEPPPSAIVTRLMLVVSDGLPGGDTDPDKAARGAEDAGVPVYPLLVGHEERVEEFNFQMRQPAPAGMNAGDFETRQNYFRTKFDATETQTARFSELGDATGGRAFDPPTLDAANARNILKALADEVRAEYVAGFAPDAGAAQSPHRIEIRLVQRKGAKITGGSRVSVY